MKLEIEKSRECQSPLYWERATHGWMLELACERGQQHYGLLASLAGLIPHGDILDIGTSTGLSSLAFAAGTQDGGHTRKISSFDISHQELSIEIADLVDLHLRPAEQITREEWQSASLALLDIGHDGVMETNVLTNAMNAGFKGIMVMDDIRASAPLATIFREWLKVRRWDLSYWFHWSGTGLLDFSGQLQVCENGRLMVPIGLG